MDYMAFFWIIREGRGLKSSKKFGFFFVIIHSVVLSNVYK